MPGHFRNLFISWELLAKKYHIGMESQPNFLVSKIFFCLGNFLSYHNILQVTAASGENPYQLHSLPLEFECKQLPPSAKHTYLRKDFGNLPYQVSIHLLLALPFLPEKCVFIFGQLLLLLDPSTKQALIFLNCHSFKGFISHSFCNDQVLVSKPSFLGKVFTYSIF